MHIEADLRVFGLGCSTIPIQIIGTGYYSNASEVVRDAIRRMWEEDEKLKKLRSAIQVGDEQLDQGEGQSYSSSRLDAITEKAFKNARNGKKISPDATG